MKRFTTYDEIESLCESMIKDFTRCKHNTNSHSVDIEAFVVEYLGIPIVYETFAEPDPGRIGFLSDGVCPLWVVRDNKKTQVLYKPNIAVVEKSLQQPKEIGRKRFTIAHEGGHFIINKHVPAQTNAAFHSEFDNETKYTSDMLKSLMSVNEMLTNRAAACLLMPRFLVLRVLQKFNNGNRIIAYDDYVMQQDQKFIIQRMADAMGVNYIPMFCRIKELDLFEMKPIDDYLNNFKKGNEVLV